MGEDQAVGKQIGGDSMKELMEHLDKAYAWLAKVQVSGESVDFLAMARQEMRAAFQAAKGDSDG